MWMMTISRQLMAPRGRRRRGRERRRLLVCTSEVRYSSRRPSRPRLGLCLHQRARGKIHLKLRYFFTFCILNLSRHVLTNIFCKQVQEGWSRAERGARS